jgi:large subunit ribosomal protein L13
VINAKDVLFTGQKMNDKLYRWHTGYVGGLKEVPAKVYLKDKPEEILRKAVLGMLPKNKLRHMQARKLRIFPGTNHLHYDKIPEGTAPINM